MSAGKSGSRAAVSVRRAGRARVLRIIGGTSRGASHVTFVEQDEAAVRELRARLAEWQAGDARVARADALHYLAGEARPFDLVFLDPPFGSELLGAAARLLEERHWLSAAALIYVECAARENLPPLPAP